MSDHIADASKMVRPPGYRWSERYRWANIKGRQFIVQRINGRWDDGLGYSYTDELFEDSAWHSLGDWVLEPEEPTA